MAAHRAPRRTDGSVFRTVRRVVVLLVALTTVFTVGGVATAFFTSTGTGTGSSTTGSLAAPTSVVGDHQVGTGMVGVIWDESTGSPSPTGYYVLRQPTSGPAVAACGTTPISTITGDSCDDTGVPIGTYTYVVVAVHRTWTAESAPSDTVPVEQAAQVIEFTSSPVSPTFGGTYTISATGGGSGNPVSFSSATPGVCTVSGAMATFVHAGTCTINADQAGDTYYAPAPQTQQTFGVAKAAQTIAFSSTAPTGTVVDGPGYTPTATGGGSGNPVAFTVTTPGVCMITADVVSHQHAGTCTVAANQAGDADHLAASEAQQSYTVGQGSQAITFTSTAPANAKVNGSTYTVTATGGASGNAVTFSSATPGVCTVAGPTVTFVGDGTCTINANQAGNADYLVATQVQQSFQVTKKDQTITFTSTAPGAATVGGSYSATATATSGLTVTFSTDTASVCTVTSGGAVSFVGVGTCHVNANQVGNAEYAAAPQVQQSFAVANGADTTAPTIVAIEPGNETGGWNSIACSTGSNTGRICVSASDNVGVTTVTITVTKSNGRCWSGSGSSSFDASHCSTPISLTLSGGVWVSNVLVRQGGGGQPNFTNTSYTLNVTVSDLAGNTISATRTFSINGF